MDAETEDLIRRVIGSGIAVHRTLGPGYLEATYEQALTIELESQNIAFERQKPFALTYREQPVGEGRLDFLIEGQLVIELKAVQELAPIHHAQLLAYLRATNCTVGLLMNFNVPVLKDGIHRVLL